jgi:hypothetical protein
MKQHPTFALICVLSLFANLQAFSHDFELDGIFYNYNLDDGTATVTSEYEGVSNTRNYTGDMIIPSSVSINGRTLKVTAIGNRAFWYCKDLKSIKLPETITTIGAVAFAECEGLEQLNIPNSIINIGANAFQNCRNLVINEIPQTVEKVDDGAFAGCCGFTTLYFTQNVSIGNSAFEGCKDLESVTISKGKIGQWAFASCPNLKQINILSEVNSIGCYVLQNCSDEISVYVEESSNPLEITTRPSNYTAKTGNIGHLYLGRGERFWGYERLKTLTIGANISEVQLNYATSLKAIYSKVEIPNQCNVNFSNNTYVNAKLYVPTGTKDKYMAAEGWKNFFLIEEMDVDKMWNGQGNPYDDSQSKEKCERPTINYANGKLSFTCATEGAICQSTITDTDISSFSGNEVQLTVTYTINVYATASGYENSDVVTATLCWIDVDPKTEGIENSVSQVRANAVLIQSHDGTLSIAGVADGTDIAVFSTSGQMVGSAKSYGTTSTFTTTLRSGSVAIVRIGDKSVKVIMQ